MKANRLNIIYERCSTVKSSRLVNISAVVKPEHRETLKRVARARGISLSELIREFANHIDSFYQFLVEQERRQSELDGNLSEWLLANSPPEVSPEVFKLMSEAAAHAAQMLEEEQREGGNR
jgi:hypothetical protein